jgi:hypothetical protein
MRYPLVLDLADNGIPVAVTCRVLGFSKQAFYAWRRNPITQRDWDDAHLINTAYDIHHDDPTFGYRFIADELPTQGISAGENRVARRRPDGAARAAGRPRPRAGDPARRRRPRRRPCCSVRVREPGHPGRRDRGVYRRVRRRIAAFDKVAVAGIKKLVDVATLPDDAEFGAGLQAYFASASRPERRPFVQLLFENGLQQPDGIETDLGTAIGKLRQNR